jgi:hypothetical protein
MYGIPKSRWLKSFTSLFCNGGFPLFLLQRKEKERALLYLQSVVTIKIILRCQKECTKSPHGCFLFHPPETKPAKNSPGASMLFRSVRLFCCCFGGTGTEPRASCTPDKHRIPVLQLPLYKLSVPYLKKMLGTRVFQISEFFRFWSISYTVLVEFPKSKNPRGSKFQISDFQIRHAHL